MVIELVLSIMAIAVVAIDNIYKLIIHIKGSKCFGKEVFEIIPDENHNNEKK